MSPALAPRATAKDWHDAGDSVPATVDPQERIDALLAHLGTRPEGLSSREAQRRLAQYGANEISRPAGRGWWRELVRQLVHPLALLLWVAAALAAASGSGTLAIAIVAVIVLNAVLAFAQELQAERATEALTELLPVRARVRRDGAELEVDAAELVPGDVVLLAEGDRLSADARLTEGSVEVDMAPLTGESEPVVRSAEASAARADRCSRRKISCSPGTLCTAGRGRGGGLRDRDGTRSWAGSRRCRSGSSRRSARCSDRSTGSRG